MMIRLEDLTPEQRGMIWQGEARVANCPADCLDLVARGLMTCSTQDEGDGRRTWLFQLTGDGRSLRDQLAKRAEGQPLVEVKPDPSPAPASRWVPVEERLPEPSVMVSVLRDWAHVSEDRRLITQGGLPYWAFDTLYPKMPVTHWLEEVIPPLPERPKEDVPEPPGKWVRWGIGECRNRARTGERYVGVSAADGKVKDIVWMAGIRGEEHFADIRLGGRAALPSPGWIIREEDFLALCQGPWNSDGKGEG